MEKGKIAYLQSHTDEIQEFIESRMAQKLWDSFFVEMFWDKLIDFGISHPSSEPMRTMDEEDQIEELMDYAFGLFLEQYAQGYINESKRIKRYNA